MRKMRAIGYAMIVAGSTMMLSGCGTLGIGTPTETPINVNDILSKARDAAIAACGFAPAIATIANIIAVGNPGVMTASAIGAAVCAAIAPPPKTATLLKAGRVATVRGWQVTPGAVNGVPVR